MLVVNSESMCQIASVLGPIESIRGSESFTDGAGQASKNVLACIDFNLENLASYRARMCPFVVSTRRDYE